LPVAKFHGKESIIGVTLIFGVEKPVMRPTIPLLVRLMCSFGVPKRTTVSPFLKECSTPHLSNTAQSSSATGGQIQGVAG